MNIQQLKKEMRDLGFEDDYIFEDETFNNSFYSSVTRALRIIATTVKAPIWKLDIDLSKSLGITTTPISAGSTTNPITIDGVSVSAQKLDIVEYDKNFFYWDGSAWQTVGRYDLAELTKENDKVIFDEIDRIVENTEKGIRTFNDYELEQDKILILDPKLDKSLTVFFKKRILPITADTPSATELPIEYVCEPLLGLLTAHYVWLDDDERKAVMYWNEFDQLRNEIIGRIMKPRARIVTEH